MKLRKLFGVLLAAALLAANTGMVYAADEISGGNDELIYEYFDVQDGGETSIQTFQSEIEDEQWDIDALGAATPELYRDFPVKIEAEYTPSANLIFNFNYLKILLDSDSASIVVSDRATDEILLNSSILAENNCVSLEDISVDRVLNVVLTENIGGNENTYSGVIVTKNDSANFPSNVSLYDGAETNEMYFAEKLHVSEVTGSEDTETVDDEGNIYVNVAPSNGEQIDVEALPEYYGSLDADKLYYIQAAVLTEGFSSTIFGFISTYSGGEELGIFVPTYEFCLEDDYEQLELTVNTNNFATMGIQTIASAPGGAGIYGEEVKQNAYDWNYFKDGYFSLNSSTTYLAIKVTYPETGYYTLFSFGLNKMNCDVWYAANADATPTFSRRIQPTGSNYNFSDTMGLVAGQIRYLVFYFTDTYSGRIGFNLSYNDYSETSNSAYQLYATGDKMDNGITVTDHIDYNRDVDVFYLDNGDGSGNYGLNINNYSVGNFSKDLAFELYEKIYETVDTGFYLWTYSGFSKKVVSAGQNKTYIANLAGASTNSDYFVYVSANTYVNSGQDYTYRTISPRTGDQYEENNEVEEATDLTSLPSYFNATLHKNDVDYYEFTTGAGGAELYVSLDWVEDFVYNIDLYTTDSNGDLELVASSKETDPDGDFLSIDNLLPLTTYYISINNSGMGSNKYHAVLEYTLYWSIYNNPVPSAVFSSNVTYNYNVNGNLANLDAFITEIMDKLTCYDGNTAISDSIAKNYVSLYYSNNSVKTPLTVTVVNSLSAGSYPITVEYKNVAATGGTVTLTMVSVSSNQIVELTGTLNTAYTISAAQDWIFAARAMGNYRRVSESMAASTITPSAAATALGVSASQRQSLEITAQAVCYYYTNGVDDDMWSYGYQYGNDILDALTEDALFDLIDMDTPLIMQLYDDTDSSNLSKTRYVVLCGVNKTQHELKIFDPTKSGGASWVATDAVFNGGYVTTNSDIKFSGAVIYLP